MKILSDFQFGVVYLKNVKHLKNLIEEYMPEDEKKKTTIFYWVMLLKYTIWSFDIVKKSLWISSHFDTENYARRLDKAENFSCLIFWYILSQNIN